MSYIQNLNVVSANGESITDGANEILISQSNLEFEVSSNIQYAKITLNTDCTERLPKLIGTRLNGNPNPVILSGAQGDSYVITQDGYGGHLLIAQGAAPFYYEGAEPTGSPIATASIFTAGYFTGSTAGNQAATQTATTGDGTGAEFTVTITHTAGGDVLTVSGLAESSFNGDYTESTSYGTVGFSGDTFTEDTSYKIFKKANGSDFDVVGYIGFSWYVHAGCTDPDGWTNGGPTGHAGADASEILTASSETRNGKNAPSSVSSSVDYTVVSSSETVTAVVSVDTAGTGYQVGDKVTLSIANSGTVNTATVLNVDSVS